MITDSLFGNAVKKEPEKMGGNVLPVEDGKPVFTVMDLGKMLLLSAKEGNTPQVRELMTKGAPFSTDWLGTSPLHLAAMNNHLDTCEVLIRAGLNKDARTKVDRTPLHFAVYEGHEQIVELLVGNQCDIDARDMLRMTPLHWAVEKRHRRIVEILLRHGADPSAESKFRKTATSMALEHGYNEIYLMLDAAFRVRMENPDQFRPPPLTAAPQSEMKPNGRTATVVQESIELGNTPSPPINSSSIDEDNGMTLSDAIIRLQTIDETRSVNPSTTLQMLKDHGISMLPTEDTENAFISSALQGGRKLVLSEAGKLMMNETRVKRSTSQQHIATSTPRMSLSPASVKPLKPPNSKVIKIVTAEEFKRMLSGDLSATKKVQLRANGAVQPAKQRRQMVVSRRPELLPAATDIFAESDSCRVKPNQVPNLLDIHAEEPLDTDPDDYTPELGVYATPAQVECSVEVKSNLPTSMGLSEIEKQLLDLKKQTEELRRQLEISQRQNEEYKVRLEKLEQEKELERRQKSHINS